MRRYIVFYSLVLSAAFAQDRIRSFPDDNRTVILAGNRHPMARIENSLGATWPDHRMGKMILVLKTSDEQQRALDELIVAQQDPTSPQYQRWLTPELFAAQFGVAANDIGQVTAWLGSHGFQVDEVPSGARTIVFSGTAGMVQAVQITVETTAITPGTVPATQFDIPTGWKLLQPEASKGGPKEFTCPTRAGG